MLSLPDQLAVWLGRPAVLPDRQAVLPDRLAVWPDRPAVGCDSKGGRASKNGWQICERWYAGPRSTV